MSRKVISGKEILMECTLCKSINEEFRVLCSDKYSVCILNKNPLKEGHVMVLPKRHVIDLTELSEKESKSLLDMTEKILIALKKTYWKDPIVEMNTGKWSSQSHLHLHVLPSEGSLRHLISRYEGFEFKGADEIEPISKEEGVRIR